MPSPKNKALYDRVKGEAKRKFKVWPSAYASGWVVKEYKRRGGGFSNKATSGRKSRKSGIGRWFEEKWINVCKLPKKVKCGRSINDTSLSDWKKKYPYCRPSRRVTKSTPKTSGELSKKEIDRRCRQKSRSPMKRVLSDRKSRRSRRASKRSRRTSRRSRRISRRR